VDIVQETDPEVKFTIPLVKLNYCHSWYEFNIDEPPATILVGRGN
jgi:hypothetical protein